MTTYFSFFFSKNFYNPDDPRDAEELLNYLEEINSDDEDNYEIKNCNELQLVLFPPQDGAESDIDDVESDGEIQSVLWFR